MHNAVITKITMGIKISIFAILWFLLFIILLHKYADVAVDIVLGAVGHASVSGL